MIIIDKLFLAKWPDGSYSVLDAEDKVELYSKLDREGDPHCAIIFEIIFDEEDGFHLKFEVGKQHDEIFVNAEVEQEYAEPAKLKKTKFPKDIFVKYLARVTGKPLTKIKTIPDEKIKEIEDGLGNSE